MTSESPSAFSALSDQIARVVEAAGASTLTVYARRRIPATGFAWADGVIVTADHVIEREDEIMIGLPDGSTAAATLAGRDPGTDIAVLRTQATLTPIARGEKPRVGSLVVAVARPGNGGLEASLGMVNALGQPWRTDRGTRVNGYIRSSVAFLPGFSGGPLLNAAGEAVGLSSSYLGRGSGLAIPAADLATLVDILLSKGRVGRGYLGIGSQPIRLPDAVAERLGGQSTALLVTSVEQASPAGNAGFFAGDTLVALGGDPITEPADLQAALGPESIGRETVARVLRGGEPVELSITIGERG